MQVHLKYMREHTSRSQGRRFSIARSCATIVFGSTYQCQVEMISDSPQRCRGVAHGIAKIPTFSAESRFIVWALQYFCSLRVPDLCNGKISVGPNLGGYMNNEETSVMSLSVFARGMRQSLHSIHGWTVHFLTTNSLQVASDLPQNNNAHNPTH